MEAAAQAEPGVSREDRVDDMRLGRCGRGVTAHDGLGVDPDCGGARREQDQVDERRSEPGVRPVGEQDALSRQQFVVRVGVEMHKRLALGLMQAFGFEGDQQ